LLHDCTDEVKGWIIYFATKDFQDNDYSFDDIKKLKNVLIFAVLIMDVSGNTPHAKKIINEFAETVEGKNLRYYLDEGNFKIVSSFNDLTKTQKDFLYFTSEDYQIKKREDMKKNLLDGTTINFQDLDLAPKQFKMMWECLQDQPPAPSE